MKKKNTNEEEKKETEFSGAVIHIGRDFHFKGTPKRTNNWNTQTKIETETWDFSFRLVNLIINMHFASSTLVGYIWKCLRYIRCRGVFKKTNRYSDCCFQPSTIFYVMWHFQCHCHIVFGCCCHQLYMVYMTKRTRKRENKITNR